MAYLMLRIGKIGDRLVAEAAARLDPNCSEVRLFPSFWEMFKWLIRNYWATYKPIVWLTQSRPLWFYQVIMRTIFGRVEIETYLAQGFLIWALLQQRRLLISLSHLRGRASLEVVVLPITSERSKDLSANSVYRTLMLLRQNLDSIEVLALVSGGGGDLINGFCSELTELSFSNPWLRVACLKNDHPLEEAIRSASHADICIAADSAPLHGMCQTEVPIIAIFSAKSDPSNWAPFAYNNVFIFWDRFISCRRCGLKSCSRASVNLCCESDAVFSQIQTALNGN